MGWFCCPPRRAEADGGDAKYLLSDQQKKKRAGIFFFFSPGFIAADTCCLVSAARCHSWDVLWTQTQKAEIKKMEMLMRNTAERLSDSILQVPRNHLTLMLVASV